MDIISRIAEEKILKAVNEGQLENLPGQGQPLTLEDDSHIPAELRMAHKILRNAGYVPREVELSREIQSIVDLLQDCDHEQEKYRQIQKLNLLVTRMNMLRPRPVNLEHDQVYYQKVVNRININSKNKQLPD